MLRSGRLPLWNSMVGCGAPHLANGQSAVFDPFHLIAYLGRLPDALAWMAAARLWFAGLGMFLLARAWGFGPWGRWFSGLAFPFCGFLVVWLLFPVTNVAIWLPWVLLATERRLGSADGTERRLACGRGRRDAPGRACPDQRPRLAREPGILGLAILSAKRLKFRGLLAWSAGVALGVGIAAVEVVPLGFYLAKSPVWADRERERTPPWQLSRPRVLDAACTALPYLYGSQRRGQPNLAKGAGRPQPERVGRRVRRAGDLDLAGPSGLVGRGVPSPGSGFSSA